MHRPAWAWLGFVAAGLLVWSPLQAQQTEPTTQTQPAKKAKKPRTRPSEPALNEEDQLSPRQIEQQPPTRARQGAPAPTQEPSPQDDSTPAAGRPEPSRTIACSGPFGKESSHLKLAQRFDSRNITFTQVDGPENSKLPASVLYPNDPKRRLEVLWQNEASRSETHLIVINGKSTWSGPKGLHLGLAPAALEKLNGKPFKLSGFDQADGGSVSDWQGGALEKLPGGCRVGVRFTPDPKAPDAARSEASGKELVSNDPKLRAVRATVAEIIFGY